MGRRSKHIAKRPVNAQHVPNTLDAPRTLGNTPQAIKTVETLRTLWNAAQRLPNACYTPQNAPKRSQTLSARAGTLQGRSETLRNDGKRWQTQRLGSGTEPAWEYGQETEFFSSTWRDAEVVRGPGYKIDVESLTVAMVFDVGVAERRPSLPFVSFSRICPQ